MDDHKLSKSLLWFLRYGASKFAKKIHSGGYINFDEVLANCSFESCTEGDLERIVSNDEMELFSIRIDPETGNKQIRANYGHSFPVEGLELPFITDVSNYHSVIYGTYWTNWDDFKINGIRKTKRNPIQFCTAIHGEKRNSVSTNSEIFIYLNLQKAMDDGLKFYETDSGVIIPHNDIKVIEPKYFLKVINAKTGEHLA